MGESMGHQFVKDHPKRINVGGQCHRFAADLLRTRVVGGEHLYAGFDLGAEVALQQFANPKVEKLQLTLISDQDVPRFDVPMNNEVPVCVVDRGTYLPKQFDSSAESHSVPLNVILEREAIDVLHHEVWKAGICRAPIKQSGDIGVLQSCQCLPLAPGAGHDELGVHPRAYELDCHLSGVLIVATVCEENDPHSPGTQLANQPVWPNKGGLHVVL